MSKPGERGFTWDSEDTYSNSDKIMVAEEKTEVARDELTVKDDVEDYVFLNPRRKRRRHSGSKSSSGHHSHHHKKKKKKTWKKVLISIVCVLLALVLITTGTALLLILKGQGELYTDDVQISAPESLDAVVQEGGDYIVYNGQTYKYNKDVTSLLFIGVDKRDFDIPTAEGAAGQADVIVLMALDFKANKLSMINIPRDTMTDVAIYSASGYYTGMQKQQICLSYAYGDGRESSCANTVASVKRVFYNIPINTYYALDLDGVMAINDSVGGVDVVSPETIEKFKQGESYHLMGKDAERFIKARVHDRPDANELRNKRHQAYANGFFDKVVGNIKDSPTYAVDLYNESAPYSCTNLDVAKVMYMAKEVALNGAPNKQMYSVPGETKIGASGYAEYTVNEKEFYEQFLSVFYTKM